MEEKNKTKKVVVQYFVLSQSMLELCFSCRCGFCVLLLFVLMTTAFGGRGGGGEGAVNSMVFASVKLQYHDAIDVLFTM